MASKLLTHVNSNRFLEMVKRHGSQLYNKPEGENLEHLEGAMLICSPLSLDLNLLSLYYLLAEDVTSDILDIWAYLCLNASRIHTLQVCQYNWGSSILLQVWFSAENEADICEILQQMDGECPWKDVVSTFFFLVDERTEGEEHTILLEANWEDCTLKVYNSQKNKEQPMEGDILVRESNPYRPCFLHILNHNIY